MPAFLDPNGPITTCVCESCESCEIADQVHCHFRAGELARFLLAAAPAFVLGGIGVVSAGRGWVWLLPWLGCIVGYFGLLEIRVMCAHCPHYAEPGNSLKCWANYGAPKLWRYRPGPMSGMEAFLFFAGAAVVIGYPVAWMVSARLWLWMASFVAASTAGVVALRTFLCTQCMNFACPLNRVSRDVREAFWERHPSVGEAWKRER
jgi:hypothetical protein